MVELSCKKSTRRNENYPSSATMKSGVSVVRYKYSTTAVYAILVHDAGIRTHLLSFVKTAMRQPLNVRGTYFCVLLWPPGEV